MCLRRTEKYYAKSNHIAEWYNTISNLGFIILGMIRIYEYGWSAEYALFTLAGICSGIHHATTQRWTIILDWIPIMWSLMIIINNHYLWLISLGTWFQILCALFILIDDHIMQTMHVPWGHVMWHVLASFAIDSMYQEVLVKHYCERG